MATAARSCIIRKQRKQTKDINSRHNEKKHIKDNEKKRGNKRN
jgi:hypothetical protein